MSTPCSSSMRSTPNKRSVMLSTSKMARLVTTNRKIRFMGSSVSLCQRWIIYRDGSSIFQGDAVGRTVLLAIFLLCPDRHAPLQRACPEPGEEAQNRLRANDGRRVQGGC